VYGYSSFVWTVSLVVSLVLSVRRGVVTSEVLALSKSRESKKKFKTATPLSSIFPSLFALHNNVYVALERILNCPTKQRCPRRHCKYPAALPTISTILTEFRDPRIQALIKNGIQEKKRSFIVVVGDRTKDAIVYLHHIMSSTDMKQNKSVLWAYKNKLLNFTR
jgi:hypothetical protein